MKKFYLLLLVLPLTLFAQNKNLTVEIASYPPSGFFSPSPGQIQWLGKSEKYIFTFQNVLVMGEAGSVVRDTILRTDEINKGLSALNEEPVKRFPTIVWTTDNSITFSNKNRFYNFDLKKRTLNFTNSIPENAVNADPGKNTGNVAYTRKNNLYIAVKGRQQTVSSEQNPGILYGSEGVHRNEFGISKGTFWSPAENKLAFYRLDETMVTSYPHVDITPRIAELNNMKYPMAGMASHQVTVGVYDVASGNTIYLKTGGDPEHYLTNITWTPDEKHILIAEINRGQDHMTMNRYNVKTGEKEKTLFEETSEAYVEPMTGPLFLNDGSGNFLWQSRRDGWNHIYLYDSAGTMLRQLTKGEWEVIQVYSTDIRNKEVFFLANKENPIEQQIYSAELKTGAMKAVTSVPGVHEALVSDGGRYVIDKFSGPGTYQQISMIDNKNGNVKPIFTGKDPVTDYRLGKTSVFTIKNEAGQDLYCRIITPAGFDSTKKYPVVIYVYGGPHSKMVTGSWLSGGGLFLNYLASKGYIVFTLDNRGTEHRGAAFEQAIFRNLGVAEVADQMKGVEYLKTLPYVDAGRIGINGWSYGGFMAMMMMVKNPGVFKAVAVGGPVIDWKWYEVMYGERYMDTPETNPEGYKNSSLLNYAKDLEGKLLIIQGYQDDRVVPQNALSFLKKCVEENKQVEFFMYPGHEHNIRGKDRIHLNEMITRFFDENL